MTNRPSPTRTRRRRRSRLRPLPILVLVAGALVGATVASAVAAQSGGPQAREYGESGVEAGIVEIRAGAEWLPVGSEGSSAGSQCTTSSVTVIVDDDFRQPVNKQYQHFGPDPSLPFAAAPDDLPASLPSYLRSFSPTGRWYSVMCDGDFWVVPEGGPSVTVAGLLQEAIDQLDPPEPQLAVVPAGLHYTQIDSWLAIDPAYWFRREATVSAGRIWVTGRADPYQAQWDMGDGTTVTCDGPGQVWRRGLVGTDPDCGHVYRRSSAGAPNDSFQLSATVSFEVSALTNAPGSYGPFPDLERVAIDSIQVGEIQAVND